MRFEAILGFVAVGGLACAAGAQQFTIAQDIQGNQGGDVYVGPNNGGFDTAGTSSDGGSDAFDGWMYPNNDSVAGIGVRRKVDRLEQYNIYRWVDTITNTGQQPFVGTIDHWGNFGSDGSENIVRNDAFGWISHDGRFQQNVGDPIIGHMKGNNAFTQNNIATVYAPGVIDFRVSLNLQPGESITLMYATFLARDQTNRANDLQLTIDTVNAGLANPLAAGLFDGLTQQEISSLANWIPAPGAGALLGLGGLVAMRRRR